MPKMLNEDENILATIVKQNETIIKQNEDIKKAISYVELKLNLLMKETYSIDSNAVKWDDEKQEQIPKTVLEVWKSLGKYDKENNNEQY